MADDERDGERYYRDLVRFARSDPACLGLAVTGSRAVGFEVAGSDYDLALFVDDGRESDVGDRLERPVEGVDLRIFTPDTFAAHARWGSETAWDRYAWAVADFVADRSGGALVAAAREKGRIPEAAVASWVDSSLDWYLNQVARSIRCLTRGDRVGGRLEAAESVRPFLQAAFAIHDRRLVPYYRYLAWELSERPLERFVSESAELVEMVSELVTVGSLAAQARVLREAERVFPAAGYGRRFGEWEVEDWWERYFADVAG